MFYDNWSDTAPCWKLFPPDPKYGVLILLPGLISN